MAARDGVEIDFVTFSMFIIDKIIFQSNSEPLDDIMGGAGSYAALGARLFSPNESSKSVGWTVDCGKDFPESIRKKINQWQTSCLFREDPKRLTTRALNTYGLNEYRGFEYLSPKIRIEASTLPLNFLRSKAFHSACKPSRIKELLTTLKQRRRKECSELEGQDPIIIWEPIPNYCKQEERPEILEAANYVDIISPNSHELASIFKSNVTAHDNNLNEEEYANRILTSGIGKNGQGSIIVRCGAKGCYLANHSTTRWFPAYHQRDSNRIVDPTGAGNTFLGGLTVALARQRSLENACIWASVAAGVAIEQIGLPSLYLSADGREHWNGQSVEFRLEAFKSILQNY